MENQLGRLSRFVTARPWITIFVILNITVFLTAGAVRRAPPPGDEAILPPGSTVADAIAEIDELFGESGEANVVTLIFRGDALTPDGLAQMDALINEIVADPAVQELFAPVNPLVAPVLLIKAVLQTDNVTSITQEQINAARGPPEIQAALDALTGTDTDGTEVAIAIVRLRDTGDERIDDAERKIDELAAASEGTLQVSSVSPAIIEDEYKKATQEGMGPLIGLALLLIAGLILLFLRTLTDLLLTLAGLFISLMWIVGVEGWLGPYALGITGPPNQLTAMVPIIVISLTVDYAIQIVSHYREQRHEGEAVVPAAQIGLRKVTIPLVLAAVTTIVSLLVSLFSPIGIIGDFGLIAGLGVGMTLIVMLTLLPAGRTIIDRQREARGNLKQPRLVATALPGIEGLATVLGKSITRAPAPYLIVVLGVTLALGYAATGIKSEFNIRDILPRGGTLMADLDTIDAAIGGSTEIVSVLIRAEATETRTLLNLRDLTAAFADEESRPAAAAGPIQASYELLVRDWIHDSGQPGDKYDSELAALFQEASAGLRLDAGLMQEFLNRLQSLDPTLSYLLVNDPAGTDAMLIQFPAYSGDTNQAKQIQESLEDLWIGDDNAIAATSEGIIGITITDAITERQTEAITTTIAVALGVLALFFWITVRQPVLSVIAVGPIVLVLISVLGTMALLDIPYSLVTSIITALSVGIGVDYTIHVIHRYREEYARGRDPEQAAIRTLATTGSALLGSALTTALGLGALIASPLLASQQFAIAASITILYSLLVSILLVPPAMTIWGAYQNVRLRSKVKRWADELDLEIEAVQRRYE